MFLLVAFPCKIPIPVGKAASTPKSSAMEMLEKKNMSKVSLKEKELQQKHQEFEFQKKKYEDQAKERQERLQLELEERRMFLQLLKDKL